MELDNEELHVSPVQRAAGEKQLERDGADHSVYLTTAAMLDFSFSHPPALLFILFSFS